MPRYAGEGAFEDSILLLPRCDGIHDISVPRKVRIRETFRSRKRAERTVVPAIDSLEERPGYRNADHTDEEGSAFADMPFNGVPASSLVFCEVLKGVAARCRNVFDKRDIVPRSRRNRLCIAPTVVRLPRMAATRSSMTPMRRYPNRRRF